MKIAYVHQYFKFPEEGGAIRSYYVAKALSAAGHDVTVITSTNKTDKKTVCRDGFCVMYLPVSYDNSYSFLRRVWSYLLFAWKAYRLVRHLSVDLVYATSTPLTVGWVGYRLRQKHRVKYVFEVRDLWPKIPIELGYIRSRWMVNWLYGWEKKIYQNASHVIALSPQAEKYIAEIVPRDRVSMVPNMADTTYFIPSHVPQQMFRVAYVGTFGKANHLKYVFDVATLCEKEGVSVEFVLMGDGVEFDFWKKESERHEQVQVIPFSGKEKVKDLLASSQACLVSFWNHPALEGMSPNKFFDGLAAGKLMIVNCKGWLKNLVEEQTCGFYYDVKQPGSFVKNIKSYLDDRSMLHQVQLNSRRLAEDYFSVSKLTKQIQTIIEALDDNGSR